MATAYTQTFHSWFDWFTLILHIGWQNLNWMLRYALESLIFIFVLQYQEFQRFLKGFATILNAFDTRPIWPPTASSSGCIYQALASSWFVSERPKEARQHFAWIKGLTCVCFGEDKHSQWSRQPHSWVSWFSVWRLFTHVKGLKKALRSLWVCEKGSMNVCVCVRPVICSVARKKRTFQQRVCH